MKTAEHHTHQTRPPIVVEADVDLARRPILRPGQTTGRRSPPGRDPKHVPGRRPAAEVGSPGVAEAEHARRATALRTAVPRVVVEAATWLALLKGVRPA